MALGQYHIYLGVNVAQGAMGEMVKMNSNKQEKV